MHISCPSISLAVSAPEVDGKDITSLSSLRLL
jgi:hypothetical protein